MASKIQLRHDSASNWLRVDPILAQGELGYETDTNKFKIGNGSDKWSLLSYFSGGNEPTPSSVAGVPALTSVVPVQTRLHLFEDQGGEDPERLKPYEKNPIYRYKGAFSEIDFTVNMDKDTIIKEMNNYYVSIDRYANTRKRSHKKYHITRRYARLDDARYQTDRTMYCYKWDRHSYNGDILGEDWYGLPTEYCYFYLPVEYDDMDELISDDPENVYTLKKSPQAMDRDYGFDYSSYATCFNALFDYGMGLSKIIDEMDSSYLSRAPEFDINTFAPLQGQHDVLKKSVANIWTKNGKDYYFWSPHWQGVKDLTNYPVYACLDDDGNVKENYVPTNYNELQLIEDGTQDFKQGRTDYTFKCMRKDLFYYTFEGANIELIEFVDEISSITHLSKDEDSENGHKVYYPDYGGYNYELMYYNCYWYDYPIKSTLLSQCEVHIDKMLPKLVGVEGEVHPGFEMGSWVKLDTLVKDPFGLQQFQLLENPRFRLPYDTYYLALRFSEWQKVCFYELVRDNRDAAYDYDTYPRIRYKNDIVESARFARGKDVGGWRIESVHLPKVGNINNERMADQGKIPLEFNLVSAEDMVLQHRSKTKGINKVLTLSRCGGGTSWLK